MDVAELLQKARFVVDRKGKKKAVLLDFKTWKELLTLVEDQEDAEEILRLRGARDEVMSWEEAKRVLGGTIGQ